MTQPEPARYYQRSIDDWLRKAEQGDIALPTFQRSHVWKSRQSIADYISALFQNRPTGLFLVLKTGGSPEFPSRPLKGISPKAENVKELLLDGQQRLTSIWQVLNGTATAHFYVRVHEFSEDISVDSVFWPDNPKYRRILKNPKEAYRENAVPLNILWDKTAGRGKIWDWCNQAQGDSSDAARELEDVINAIRQEFLLKRYLQYCELPAETSRETAIDIFVQSNKSSVKVSGFDIAVALATEKGDDDAGLREQLSHFHERSDITRHYIPHASNDPEVAITPLGEWMLFAGCLTQRPPLSPKRQHYEKVVMELVKDSPSDGKSRFDELLASVQWALSILADHGAPTRSSLPSLPPLHVLSGLSKKLQLLYSRRPVIKRLTQSLVSAYIWRAFLTKRYEASANDKLFEDFSKLDACLDKISSDGDFDWEPNDLPPIFNLEDYPVPDAETLGSLDRPLPWLGLTDRLGRAIGSVSLNSDPVDWATGEKLTCQSVRKLESKSKLDRHHIFPKALLQEHEFNRKQIDHALNGILLSKSSNNDFSRSDPKEYLSSLLEQRSGPTEKQLRDWVQSHLVPYDALMAEGTVETRYRDFIKARAELLAKKIQELTNPRTP